MLLLFVACSATGEAWSADPGPPEDGSSPDPLGTVCTWGLLPGAPARNALYLGMWSHHFGEDDDDDYRTANHLIGGAYRGCYAGTFINSSNDRTVSLGWQRDLFTQKWSQVRLDLGYRLGVMYGYDDYSLGDTKLFPLGHLYADVAYRNVGLQFSWVAEVVTVGFLLRFP